MRSPRYGTGLGRPASLSWGVKCVLRLVCIVMLINATGRAVSQSILVSLQILAGLAFSVPLFQSLGLGMIHPIYPLFDPQRLTYLFHYRVVKVTHLTKPRPFAVLAPHWWTELLTDITTAQSLPPEPKTTIP